MSTALTHSGQYFPGKCVWCTAGQICGLPEFAPKFAVCLTHFQLRIACYTPNRFR